ncbi:MAG: DUF6106 family protein [Huintestinicola sp.]
MLNDMYAEQLIEKKSGGADILKKIGIMLGISILCALVLMFIIPPISLIGVAGLLYLAYYLLTGCGVEYEYIFTNGDLDIDKVTGKRKRKRLITAKLTEFTAFGKLSEAPASDSGITTVLASDGTGEGEYFADFKHASAGKVRLIFTPNEKLLEAIVAYLPRQLKSEYLRNH